MEESDFDEIDIDHLDRLFEDITEEKEDIDWDDPLIFDALDD